MGLSYVKEQRTLFGPITIVPTLHITVSEDFFLTPIAIALTDRTSHKQNPLQYPFQ